MLQPSAMYCQNGGPGFISLKINRIKQLQLLHLETNENIYKIRIFNEAMFAIRKQHYSFANAFISFMIYH